jgi:hypothetical protein
MDGTKRLYEQAAIITNDSDLTMPISIVRYELKFPVYILNPHEFHFKKLRRIASSLGRIRNSDLSAAQFDAELTDAHGKFHRPKAWD